MIERPLSIAMGIAYGLTVDVNVSMATNYLSGTEHPVLGLIHLVSAGVCGAAIILWAHWHVWRLI